MFKTQDVAVFQFDEVGRMIIPVGGRDICLDVVVVAVFNKELAAAGQGAKIDCFHRQTSEFIYGFMVLNLGSLCQSRENIVNAFSEPLHESAVFLHVFTIRMHIKAV